MTTLLLIEDNPKHLADAKVLLEDRVKVGAINGVDYATNLTEAEELLRTRKYDGIISDVFFPKEAGGIEQQMGTTIGQYALDHKIPFVLVTSTHHHGYKTEPVNQWISERGMKLIDVIDQVDARYGEAVSKKWDCGYVSVLYLKEAIEKGIFIFTKGKDRFTKEEIDTVGIWHTKDYSWGFDDPLSKRDSVPYKIKSDNIFREVIQKYCSGMFDDLIKNNS